MYVLRQCTLPLLPSGSRLQAGQCLEAADWQVRRACAHKIVCINHFSAHLANLQHRVIQAQHREQADVKARQMLLEVNSGMLILVSLFPLLVAMPTGYEQPHCCPAYVLLGAAAAMRRCASTQRRWQACVMCWCVTRATG
jgi:hypothetical protein